MLAGALAVLPLAGASWLTVWLFRSLDGAVVGLLPGGLRPEAWSPVPLPGFGLAVGLLATTLLGMLSAGFIGRFLLYLAERRLIARVPFVGALYGGLKRTFGALLREKGGAFRRAVAVQCPHRGLWTVAFATAAPPPPLRPHLPADATGIFLPAVPNPTTGFLLFLSESETRPLDLPVESALRMVVSGGVIASDSGRAPRRGERADGPAARVRRSVRRRFLAGVLVGAPVLLTIWICLWLVSLFDGLAAGLLPASAPVLTPWLELPGVGIAVVLLALMLTGMLLGGLAGDILLSRLDAALSRVPVLGSFHSALKTLLEGLLSPRGQAFRRAVLFEYPREGVWAIGLVTAESDPLLSGGGGGEGESGGGGGGEGEVGGGGGDGGGMISVFMPTTPNPTTGFFLMVPRERAVPLSVGPEEAFRMVLSVGLSGEEEEGDAPGGGRRRRGRRARGALRVVEPGGAPGA